MSGCPFIQISRMIRSLSSSLCALSSSSADVNTFMLSVRSKRRCLRADRSEVVSQSESESLESEDESGGRGRFLAGGRWRGWQSVRQEICTTRAKRVRKRPKHTPQTKNSAALSGWSVVEEKLEIVSWLYEENVLNTKLSLSHWVSYFFLTCLVRCISLSVMNIVCTASVHVAWFS